MSNETNNIKKSLLRDVREKTLGDKDFVVSLIFMTVLKSEFVNLSDSKCEMIPSARLQCLRERILFVYQFI